MNLKIFFLLIMSSIVQTAQLKIKSLNEILLNHPEIEYIKCHDEQYFHYDKFPISKFPELQPNEGLFAQTFILKIPNGQTFSNHGFIKVDDFIIEDCLAPYLSIGHLKYIIDKKFPKSYPTYISGKVAVITMLWDNCYAHWMYNILGRLALLELYNVKYDYLYVASDIPYMKETLSLWGISPNKILSPFREWSEYIQAEELIVPCHIGKLAPMPNQFKLNWVPIEKYCKLWKLDSDIIKLPLSFAHLNIDTPLSENINIKDYFLSEQLLCGLYYLPWAVEYIRNKFLPLIKDKNYNFSKKIFISRKDASIRRMLNEDEVFSIFENCGFKRYILSKFSIVEQIALFANADIVVAAHGSSLVNIMFCKPNTKVIEIFQGRSDCDFCYLSKTLNLNYYPIKTTEFKNIAGLEDTDVPLNIIYDIVEKIL